MTTEEQAILESALSLPNDIRAEIAHRLPDSIEDDAPIEFDEATLQEARRRLEELRNGAVQGIPAEEVIAAAKARSVR